MTPIFKRKDGSLTLYAFACGYIQKKENGNNEVTLFFEHRTFHVIHMKEGKRQFWQSFDPWQMTKAKQLFNKTKIK